MTIIAWDGTLLASDKMAVYCGHKTAVEKLYVYEDGILGVTGAYENGLGLVKWFRNGSKEEKWPVWQSSEEWCRLVVFTFATSYKVNRPYLYEKLPFKQYVNESFMAFGSGRDYALGALAMGADAIKAVEVACSFCDSCGMGIDAYNLETAEKVR